MVRKLLSVLMLVLAGPVLAADAMPPATQPAAATQPATLPSDASTPRGALRMVFNATDAGDESVLRALLYTANPLEERVADATAKMSSSTTVLHKALLNNLGPEAAKQVVGDVTAAARARDSRIPFLVETISPDGNTATVRLEGLAAFEPVEFRKVDGQWKWRVGKSVEGVPANVIEQRMAMLAIQAKVNTDTAADISAGKLKTVADVKQTMEARIRQRIMEYVQAQQKSPATAPAQ